MSSNATKFLMLLTTATTTPSPLRYPSLLRLTRHHSHHIPSSLSSLSHHHLNLFSHSLPYPLKINSSPCDHYHHQLHTSAHFSDSPSPSTSFPSTSGFSHPWPEWSNFVKNLSVAGYFNIKHGFNTPIDEVISVDDLPEEFLHSCTASLAFARDKPHALGMLSRRDIEVVVQNGSPFLFKNSDDSVRRMELFLHGSDSNVKFNVDSERTSIYFDVDSEASRRLMPSMFSRGNIDWNKIKYFEESQEHFNVVPNTDKARTLDLMKFLLSYASILVSSEKTNLLNAQLVESSVRSLFTELTQLGYNAVETTLSGSFQNQFPDRYGQTPRPRGQNIEMKRGDWICSR
ncbi:unnamed protein product [Dovyalis caffra]|uniref:Uncharacterized protein n=1 Tax=Dovyalis caffra TaxID=77055 RepID=A0AAV1RX81_9ROSI|nr:unnamed protein product [Dovyalis caffra]